MTIYYLTIATLAGLGYVLTDTRKQGAHKGQKNSRACAFYLAVSFLLLVFLSSCRYAIGFDYFSYRNIYEIASQLTYADILRLHPDEPLFFLACKLFGMMGFPYQMLLLMINFFLMSVAILFIRRYSKIPWVSVYLYITLQFLAYNMNLIRQSIATAFFLLRGRSEEDGYTAAETEEDSYTAAESEEEDGYMVSEPEEDSDYSYDDDEFDGFE